MSDTPTSTPHTWVKRKYVTTKTVGRYRSNHNDGKRRVASRRKLSDRERAAVRATQPRVVLVIGPTGKRRFVRAEYADE